MAKLTTFSKLLITLAIVGIAAFLILKFAPKIAISEAKKLDGLALSNDDVNNVITSEELPLPTTELSKIVSNTPLIRLGAYAWNAQSGIICANGGSKTTVGSQMEKEGVNFELVRQDWLSELRNQNLKFIDEYNSGQKNPKNGVLGVIIMGDGAPYYISSTQQALDDKYGVGKYHLQVIGCVGLSFGEDKLIGPPKWKLDPQTMKGSLISTVIGDGDWVTSVNYAFANGIKVNPDPTTYDEEAVNFYPSANDDYIESAKELIKSNKEGWKIPLKEIKNGKLTGKTIDKLIDGCATWTPGDKMVFDQLEGFTDIVSTKEFNNQMAATIIVLKEWAEENPKLISSLLKASFNASNQMKQYESWKRKAADIVASTYQLENGEYWYNMFKGQKGEKNGISYNMGGSRVFNLADVRQYYGLGQDGVSRYKAVYDQVSFYLKELNPAGINQNVKRLIPYEEAINLSFLQSIQNADEGNAYAANYDNNAKTKLSSGQWQINFNTGRAQLKDESTDLLNQIYNLIIQAEDSKIEIIGHTDNIGSAESNIALSIARAEAVKTYLMQKGVPGNRFQKIDGKGQEEPIADNNSSSGKAKNRRVEISLLK